MLLALPGIGPSEYNHHLSYLMSGLSGKLVGFVGDSLDIASTSQSSRFSFLNAGIPGKCPVAFFFLRETKNTSNLPKLF